MVHPTYWGTTGGVYLNGTKIECNWGATLTMATAAYANTTTNQYDYYTSGWQVRTEAVTQILNNIPWVSVSGGTGSGACTYPVVTHWGTGYTGTTAYYQYEYQWCESGWKQCSPAPKSPSQRLKEILKSRRFPGIITQTKPVGHTIDEREVRARETLRRVIGEDKYKNFLKQGWVSVKARSGLVYQIFPGHGITNVFNRGTKVERLCVVLNGNFPPTDSVIIRYLLILNNENMFRSKAVKHTVAPRVEQPTIAFDRPIIEIAREIRGTLAKAV